MKKVKIEVSARHLHIAQDDLEKLFGVGYELQKLKDLSQLGEFTSKETIDIKTEDGELKGVRILGPVRSKTQIEISRTDARKLKINPPVRLSGDITGSLGATLIGPSGDLELKEGVIVAKRHIHCNQSQADELGLKDGQEVSVKTFGDRSLTFHNVPVRIKDVFDLSMHIDTDEGNASSPDGVCSEGEIINK